MTKHERCRTKLFDREISSPILLASGPLSDSAMQIKSAISAGASGVVTKTIFYGERKNHRECIVRKPYGVLNSTTYSHRSLDVWSSDIEVLVKSEMPVIVSVHADSANHLGQLIRKVVKDGILAIELGLSCPSRMPENPQFFEDIVASYTKSACKATQLPVSVKLTATDRLLTLSRIALDNGATAITVSDALPALAVDVESNRLLSGRPMGYSGAAIKPIILHAIYRLRRAGIDCPIIGVGGIGSVTDILEYLQVGCVAVQVLSEAMASGVELFRNLRRNLDSWCEERGLSVTDVIGRALLGGIENE